MKLRVVFDTNVYIAMLLGGKGATQLLRFWYRKKFRVYTSKLQIAELKEVVERDFQGKEARKTIAPESLENLLHLLKEAATVLPNRKMGKYSPDADDDWIVAIAIKSKSDYLVSENTKDINQQVVGDKSTIKVVTIAKALKMLDEV